MKQVEFRKLLGFAAVSDELGDSVDFQADVIEAKLGAKVGIEAWVACEEVAVQDSGEERLAVRGDRMRGVPPEVIVRRGGRTVAYC